MLHLVWQNFWQERRKRRAPCGTFFRNQACVQRLLPPLRKNKGEGAFPNSLGGSCLGRGGCTYQPKSYDGP